MSVDTSDTTLQSQYEAKITADLALNTQEQERIRTDMAALQAQLDRLERDRVLLLDVRQVFTGSPDLAERQPTAEGGAAVAEAVDGPSAAGTSGEAAKETTESGGRMPRQRKPKAPAAATGGKRGSARSTGKADKTTARTKGGKAAAKQAGKQVGKPRPPSLTQLLSSQLAAHGEPQSAAEVTAALAEQHPERNANVNVVRNALEALVARSAVHRTKQQNSVFYTHAEAGPSAEGTRTAEDAPTAA